MTHTESNHLDMDEYTIKLQKTLLLWYNQTQSE